MLGFFKHLFQVEPWEEPATLETRPPSREHGPMRLFPGAGDLFLILHLLIQDRDLISFTPTLHPSGSR